MFNYVAVIGIDGMGAFNGETSTPFMDEIYKNGAYTYRALSMNPTISAQNWGGMLLGATPEAHKLTNSVVSEVEYKNRELPSAFYFVRQAYPEAYLASVCNWDPINFGIIESDIGVEKLHAGNDDSVCDLVVGCVKKKPKFLFVQLDDVDGAGHSFGYGKEGHLKEITHADSLVGRIYSAYKAAGIADETLFITVADHGGYRNGHGGMTESERYVWLAAAGKGVLQGEIKYAVTKDISALVLYALGIEIPVYDENGYSSQVPGGIFDGVGDDYKIIADISFVPENKPTPALNSERGLYSFFDPSHVKLAMFFDNDLSDASGKCEITEFGHVKFYNVGVRSSRAELGKTGHFTIKGLEGMKCFTFAFWVSVDLEIPDEAVIITSMDDCTPSAHNDGYKIVNKSGSTVCWFEKDSVGDGFLASFGNISSGCVHCVISFDIVNDRCRQWVNFKPAVELSSDMPLPGFSLKDLAVGDDRRGIRNNESGMLVNMDDLLVFDYAFDDEDVKKLERYYD